MNAVTTIQSSQAYEIREKLMQLEQALLTADPDMPKYLRTIHRQLKDDAELVTILTEEECSILVRGLKKQTGTEIATKAATKPAKKSLKLISLADL